MIFWTCRYENLIAEPEQTKVAGVFCRRFVEEALSSKSGCSTSSVPAAGVAGLVEKRNKNGRYLYIRAHFVRASI